MRYRSLSVSTVIPHAPSAASLYTLPSVPSTRATLFATSQAFSAVFLAFLEVVIWSGDIQPYQSFVRQFPDGKHNTTRCASGLAKPFLLTLWLFPSNTIFPTRLPATLRHKFARSRAVCLSFLSGAGLATNGIPQNQKSAKITCFAH